MKNMDTTDAISIVGLALWMVWLLYFIIKEIVISIWEKRKQSLMKRKIQPSQSNRNQEVENIYEEPKVVELAKLCKMGDIAAMLDMAYFFRDCCEKPLRELLDAYELKPVEQNEDLINEYLKEHYREKDTVKTYMMWLVRAALYGNEEANLLVERCPYYKKESYIPYAVYTDKDSNSMSVWSSDSLWKTGIIDMVRGKTDCKIIFCKEKSYFDFWYVDSYCPPDEDGFGAEWDYADAYYNEFFCRIPVNAEEDISGKLLVLEKTREAYWKDPNHNASERKYRRRLCTEG